MNNSYENIEELLLQKSYYELTVQEREVVTNEIGSEHEYENMREALLAISDISENENVIEPKKETKTVLLAMFDKSPNRKFIWLNSTWFWLFPTDKPFYNKPAFQFATVALLLVGSFSIMNNSFKTKENNVAQHQSEKPKEKEGLKNRKAKENDKLRNEQFDSLSQRKGLLEGSNNEVKDIDIQELQKIKLETEKFVEFKEKKESEIVISRMWEDEKDFGTYLSDDEVVMDMPAETVAPPEGFSVGKVGDLKLVTDCTIVATESTVFNNVSTTSGVTVNYSYDWNETPAVIEELSESEEETDLLAKESSRVSFSKSRDANKDADLYYKDAGLLDEASDKNADIKKAVATPVTISAENQIELIELLNTSY